jgi:hypothetical protein
MRALLTAMGVVLALALVGCGDEGDGGDGEKRDPMCVERVKDASGRSYCVPDPRTGMGICVRDPAPEGRGADCGKGADTICKGMVIALMVGPGPIEGEVDSFCTCVTEEQADRICTGEPINVS